MVNGAWELNCRVCGVMMLDNNNFSALDNLNLDIKQNLLKYATIRIDLKNSGLKNDVEILECSQKLSYKRYPDWFCDEKGRGLILQSYDGFLDFKIKCINDGSLRIAIRGINFLNETGEKFPVYINIEEFYLNETSIIQNKSVWHDEPYIFFKDVEDSEIVHIKVKWLPINKRADLAGSLKLRNDSLKSDNAKLRKEISKLKSDLRSSNNKNNSLQKDLNEYKEENFDLLVNLEKIAKENYVLRKDLDELKINGKRHFINKK